MFTSKFYELLATTQLAHINSLIWNEMWWLYAVYCWYTYITFHNIFGGLFIKREIYLALHHMVVAIKIQITIVFWYGCISTWPKWSGSNLQNCLLRVLPSVLKGFDSIEQISFCSSNQASSSQAMNKLNFFKISSRGILKDYSILHVSKNTIHRILYDKRTMYTVKQYLLPNIKRFIMYEK